MMRAGFRMILDAEEGIQVVGEAGTGAEGVRAVASLRPDVVCMDVQMPDMDGLEATRRIVAEADAATAVLVVTTFDRDEYLFSALEAGASGFLLKNAGPEELVAAIRVVAGGDALLAPELTRRVIARFAGAGRGGPVAEPVEAPNPPAGAVAGPQGPPLTDREAEVLQLVTEALSNAEIAKRLYIGEATVKTHVSNVLQKLGARDRVHAVVVAHRLGLA